MSIPFLDNVSITGDLSATGNIYAANFPGSGNGGSQSPSDALLKSGGTLTGGLTGTSAVFTQSISSVSVYGTFYGDGSHLINLPPAGTVNALPLSGGTLTGGVTGTSLVLTNNFLGQQNLTVVGNISAGGNLYGYGDHIIFSRKKTTVFVGDGVNVLYTVHHGLGSEDILVNLYEVATKSLVYASVEIIDSNNLRIEFSNPPTTNAYKVVAIS